MTRLRYVSSENSPQSIFPLREGECATCNFLSALFTRPGKLICAPVYTDSHSDLMDWAGIKERDTPAPVQQFVKLELTPPEKSADWLDVANWKEVVDEHEAPEWFDKAARFDAFEQMRGIITDAITDGDGRLTFGKLTILRSGAARVRGGRVTALGSSEVTALDSSKVTAFDSSEVTAFGSSKVTALDSSKVTAFGSSKVTAFGSSEVTARDSSKVSAWNSSEVTAWDSSKVSAWNSSKVTAFGSSEVTARGSSVTVIDERTTAAQ